MSIRKLLYSVPAVLLLAANVISQNSDAKMPRPLVVDSAKIQPTTTFTTQSMLAAVVNTTVVAGENLTVGSTVWLPAESVAPGR